MTNRPMTVAEVADLTGFSMRYWQRRLSTGDIPGGYYITIGARRTYRIEADKFLAWWKRQRHEIPCQKISESGVASGGTGSPKTASRTKARYKPTTSGSLKTAFKEFAKS